MWKKVTACFAIIDNNKATTSILCFDTRKKKEMREAKIGQPSSFMVNNEHMQ